MTIQTRPARQKVHRLRVAILGLVAGVASGQAAAEAPSTSFPLCWAPTAARMGGWTAYDTSFGSAQSGSRTLKLETRIAMVGRTRDRRLIESQWRMAQSNAPFMVMQAALDANDTSGKPRKLLVQIEDGQPLDASSQQNGGTMPVPDLVNASQGHPRRKEIIRFDGKHIEAAVLEARDARGMVWRVWCAKEVQPLGVVRLEMRGEKKGREMFYQMIAVSGGDGARPRVVGRSRPYSDEALFRQMSQAARSRPQTAR